jgi:hypothetical protein
MSSVSLEIAKIGRINDSIKFAYKIPYDNLIYTYYSRDEAFKNIFKEIVKQDRIFQFEIESKTILNSLYFQSCWKEIAKTKIEEKGVVVALETLSHLQNEEVRKYFIKGLAENVTINDLSEELLLKALPLYKNDPESIEHLLQTHAINELFFGVATNEEIQKFNRTLNIQWAKDIKHQIDSNS